MSLKNIKLEDLQTPDISFSGLKIWIHSRQFPDSNDYWDANWLNITVYCGSGESQVWAQGPIIHLGEIEHWLKELEEVYKNLKGEASLPCTEPNLTVKVKFNKLGNASLIVQITPNHLLENHEYNFEIDQSFLPSIIKELKSILDRYPVTQRNKKT